ncbi:hypothetical protein LCGC14_1975970 [marine sediment metagenome]|uniref:Uncharacterized protein n=1 Tax=marine sediment metagenome TaxID=412755 RepID=A0A0F9FYJ9_9ZZZZ
MTTEELIEEMQAVKTAHPTLEIPDVLRIFSIQAMQNLTDKIARLELKI